MKVEPNEKVMVFPPVRLTAGVPASVTGENDGCHTLTVPSVGVPVVPPGTVMVTDERLLPVDEVVNPNVYVVPVLVVAAVDDHERLVSVPNALAGRADTSAPEAAMTNAISTMSVVRPRPTRRRDGRPRGPIGLARIVV
jgi:hypothetical protein